MGTFRLLSIVALGATIIAACGGTSTPIIVTELPPATTHAPPTEAPPTEAMAIPTESDQTQSETVLPLEGTRWHYVDVDWEYDIEFLAGGKLQSTHPDDTTPDNDTWEQQGTTVRFYFNDGFSSYEGKLSGDGLMSGTAESPGRTWTWQATRIR